MARLVKILCVLACVALMAGCAYEQDLGQALTPDELTLSMVRGKIDTENFMGWSMPDSDTRAYGVAFTWYLK